MSLKIALHSLFVCLILCGSAGTVSAQRNESKNQKLMNKANELFRQYQFSKAIEIYETLEIDGSRTAVRKIADAYRLMNEQIKAEEYYARAVQQDHLPEQYYFHYARTLMANGKYTEAIRWFETYRKYDLNDRLSEQMIASCRNALNRTPEATEFTLVRLPINTDASEFGPAFYDQGILFTSSRIDGLLKKRDAWTNSGFLDMYYTPVVWNDTVAREQRLKGSVNTLNFHDGPGCVSPDGRYLYFTRNNVMAGSATASRSGEIKLKIFRAERSGDAWKNTTEPNFNGDEYSCAYPTISSDAKTLYFASDRAGGYGGTDIYYTTWNERYQRWNRPENAGELVNTAGDERFPYLHPDGTLYFASDGHLGYGGLDLFSAAPADTLPGVFQRPVNLGPPFNTNRDDFSLIIDEARVSGYFASDRPGGAGSDDIYRFTRAAVPVRIAADPILEGRSFQVEFESDLHRPQGLLTTAGALSERLLPDTEYRLRIFENGQPVALRTIRTSDAGISFQWRLSVNSEGSVEIIP